MHKKQTARNKAGGLETCKRIKKVGAFNSSRIQAKKTTRRKWALSALNDGVYLANSPNSPAASVLIRQTPEGATLTHCGQGSAALVRDLLSLYRNRPPNPNGTAELKRRDHVTTPQAVKFSGLSRASLYRHLKPYKGGRGKTPSLWVADDVKALQERLRASQGAT